MDRTVLTAGIGSLSEFLDMNGVDNNIFDMRLGYQVNDLLKK